MRRLTVPVVLFALLLSACGGEIRLPVPDIRGDGQGAEEIAEQITQAPPATPTPALFKETLVMCTLDVPTNLITGQGPTADAIRAMLMPPPVVFGTDFVAEVGPVNGLLTALPSTSDATLTVNDLGETVVTLSYRQDLVWSDGEPFDAADAALGMIVPQGADKPTFEVTNVTQVGDYTLQVTAAPGAEYPFVPFSMPLPVHVLGESVDPGVLADSDYARNLIPSLGAFVVSGAGEGVLNLQQSATFRAALGTPNIEVRTVADANALATEVAGGACDVALDGSLTPEQIPALAGVNSSVFNSAVREQLYLSTYAPSASGRFPYFVDVRVRQAMMHAINREAIASTNTSLGVLDSWIVPGHWANPGEGALTTYDYNPAMAETLLSDAGWVDSDGDGIRDYNGDGGEYSCQRGFWNMEEGAPFAPVLVIPDADPVRAATAEQIQTDLDAVGIDVSIRPVDASELFGRFGPITTRQFDMALLAGVTRPDPDGIALWVGSEVFLHPTELRYVHRWELEDRYIETLQLVELTALDNTPSVVNDFTGQNFAGWCNEGADVAIVEADVATSVEAAAPAYIQHQQIFAQEVPVVTLYARPDITASKPYVCGLQPGPYDPLTWNISSWYYDEAGICAE